MLVYPAIDMKDGRCVRLLQGREQDVTDYGDPVATASRWKAEGASWMHLVDLDGAFSGHGKNRDVIHRILRSINVPVQLGGGIRTLQDVEDRLDNCGVTRVILGTAALENPSLVASACREYPGRVAVGIDARDGFVAVHGWVTQSNMTALDLALRVRDVGVTHIIYTDIARDGMMAGANAEQTAQMVEKTGMHIIGSGGVTTLEDITAMRDIGCEGVITGKALYQGAFTLKEAIGVAERTEEHL